MYFGNGLWGVEAASLGYCGKHASELTVPEAALLAGLIKSPSTYAPTVELDQAIRRRNTVLQAMYDTDVIDRQTLEKDSKAPFVPHDAFSRQEPHGEYFFEDVRKSLVDRFGHDRVIEYCDVHGAGLPHRFVGLIAGRPPLTLDSEPSPEDTSAPPSVAFAPPDQAAAGPDTTPKKRGFWSRLFHPRADR